MNRIKSVGDFKQSVLRIYNLVNREIVSYGVKQQSIETVHNLIVIRSVNSRAPVLKILDEEDVKVAECVNWLLQKSFKRKLKQVLWSELQLNIINIFKDYDVQTEESGTIIVLDKDVEEYLNDIPKLI